jgi:cytochrome c peroxidase
MSGLAEPDEFHFKATQSWIDLGNWRVCTCLCLILLAAMADPAWADNDELLPDFPRANLNIGERLFLETRFSQYFYANSGGDPNREIAGDPVVAKLNTTSGFAAGPFAGQAMNCRQCHLVDEKGYGDFGDHTLGNRTYADFARRTPIPLRDDGRTNTTRNAQALVDALLPHNGPLFLHHDGQFASVRDLIIGTLTGRNYGWKPEEYATAVHHIASVIRNDDGMGDLAVWARGGRFAIQQPGYTAYSNVFSGFTDYIGSYIFDPRVITGNLISPEHRLDMRDFNSTDEQILTAVATLIEAYLRNLTFAQATNGVDFFGVGTPIFNGSPFDVFLIKNHLPQLPQTNETALEYSDRLVSLVNGLTSPEFVTDPDDGHFETQKQIFRFGPKELRGLKIFLTRKASAPNKNSGIGNCSVCHSLPAFTDFIFHNTGATEQEYDVIHGAGAFKALYVPDLATRQSNYDAYLPPTPQHPHATGIFESPPSRGNRNATDLGLWNVFANPDFPAPQAGIAQILPQLLGLSVPKIVSAKIQGGHFIFSGSNGVPGAVYYVLAAGSTDLPVANWETIATNTFDQFGHFDFSIPVSPETSGAFFRVSLRMPTADEVLPRTIGLFKTPTLRDLAHSDPYLHTGTMNTIEGVLRFYQKFAAKARRGQIRNPDPELRNIFLSDTDVAPLAAFIRSLNEDYTD